MLKVRVGDFKLTEGNKQAVLDVLSSGRISEGEKVRLFEKKWAEFIGTKYAVATSSGTAALIVALSAAKHAGLLSDGANIITTPVTYIATSNAIALLNMNPVFADIDPVTFGINYDSVKSVLENSGKKCSAVLPVHLMGYPADMDGLAKLCTENNMLLFEDSAQAHGSVYNGKKTGSMGLLSAFSFYLAHNVQAGELGAVTTNDKELYRLMKKLKANGRSCDCEICTRSSGHCKQLAAYTGEDDFDPRFTHDMIGYNFKTMEFPAAIAVSQIAGIDEIIRKRQENVKSLNALLSEFSESLQLPQYSDNVSYLAYPLVVKPGSKVSRKKIRQEFENKGVETRPIFGCIPTQQLAYAHLKEEYKGKLPNAEYVGSNGFYIGCHQYLTSEDIEYVAKCFKEIFS